MGFVFDKHSRKILYELCKKYNVIILEDPPIKYMIRNDDFIIGENLKIKI